MTRHGPPEAIAWCACGGWYGDDADGREAHKKVFGHYPDQAAENAAAQPPECAPEKESGRDE